MVVGLSGTELTGVERAWLRLIRPAGIILFRRNIADARQILRGGQRGKRPVGIVIIEAGIEYAGDAETP